MKSSKVLMADGTYRCPHDHAPTPWTTRSEYEMDIHLRHSHNDKLEPPRLRTVEGDR